MFSLPAPRPRRLLFASAAALLAVGVVFVAFRSSSPPRSAAAASSHASASSSVPARSVAQLFDLAKQHAKAWESDAKMIRFYVADAGRDGSLEPDKASAQAVFVSSRLSSLGVAHNALRWQLQAGKVSSQAIGKYPVPALGYSEPAFCELAKVAGVDAPQRVGVDLSYVTEGDREPRLSVFTKSPKWLAVADPFGCEVKGRTDKELKGSSEVEQSSDMSVDAAVFDRGKAHEALRASLAKVAGCKRKDGPTGMGLLAVLFAPSGRVQSVEFRTQGYAGTPVGDCIEKLVREAQIPPYSVGRGYVATKFDLD